MNILCYNCKKKYDKEKYLIEGYGTISECPFCKQLNLSSVRAERGNSENEDNKLEGKM